uniref:Uncharacterized protein n=1 Tax=Oryza punctata TaxID=4537 RepID=A0A0E0MNV0_ORYPU
MQSLTCGPFHWTRYTTRCSKVFCERKRRQSSQRSLQEKQESPSMADPRNAGDDLGGRMKLIASMVDSKLYFHKDAMAEYMDIRKVVGDLVEEKARMEQEHHGRVLMASTELQEELDAANRELLRAKQQIAQALEELAAAEAAARSQVQGTGAEERRAGGSEEEKDPGE